MKIITKRPDYYDSVAYTYGGGDPKIVYRRIEPPEHMDIPENLRVPLNPRERFVPYRKRVKTQSERYYCWLAFCGRYYPVEVCIECSAKKYDANPDLSKIDRKTVHFIENQPEYDDALVQLSRITGHPIFMIDRPLRSHRTGNRGHILNELPHLGDMHFGRVMPPEQTYQQVAYFVGNMMHESPDANPPAEVSEQNRIEQHGFDLKNSFRRKGH